MRLFTIPNFLTLGNLFCGCLGIVFVFQSEFELSGYCIFLALIFDFFDGFAARALKINSEIGKQLDSLADVTTFGVLPGLMIFRYIEIYNGGNLKYIAFSLALFSALRLAKFNVDDRQSDKFIGLPTPANGLLVATFPFLISNNDWMSNLIKQPTFLIAYTIVFSYLLIMELPLFALKFKDFSFTKNRVKYIFLILSVILLFVMHFSAVPIIILVYLLLSFLGHYKLINI